MITVVGSSNTDFTIKVGRFPSVGETVFGRDIFVSGGGKGANQAAAIAKLGGNASLIANVGCDRFGDERVRELARAGVNTRCVRRDKLRHSGVAFIMVDRDGKNLITVSPGSNNFLKLGDVLRAKGCIKNSDILLAQLEIPIEAVRGAIYLAKRFNKRVILNPAPARSLGRDILSKVDILVPNEVELSMLTGAGKPGRDILSQARLLLKSGTGCVIVTLGKRGVLLVDRKQSRFFRARKVRVVDTTCAGDAFCGALAFCLDKGKTTEEAVEFAVRAASLACVKLGAQCSLPTSQQVNNSFKERGILRGKPRFPLKKTEVVISPYGL